MRILLIIMVVQSLNLVIFAWFNRVEQPKLLLHDNDGKFGQFGRPLRAEGAGKQVSCRSAFDAWLWQEMGIQGIPIPYGAPNAAAHIGRLIGILRRECLDRILIWNEWQLRCAFREFIGW